MMAYNNEQMRLERDSKVVEAFKRLRLPAMAGLFKEIVDGSITIGEVDVATLLELFIDAGAFVIICGGPKSGTTYLGCAIAASAYRLDKRTLYIRYFDLLS